MKYSEVENGIVKFGYNQWNFVQMEYAKEYMKHSTTLNILIDGVDNGENTLEELEKFAKQIEKNKEDGKRIASNRYETAYYNNFCLCMNELLRIANSAIEKHKNISRCNDEK